MLSVDQKARIISQSSHSYQNLDILSAFFKYNDVGVPLSQCYVYDLCELTEEGEEAIDETWLYLCEVFGKDPNENYENIDEILQEYLDLL